jgi:F420H(2)-dependent quinone reductase
MTELRTVRSSSLPPKAVMRVANIFVSLLLRSPLHRPMSAYLLLLTYTGRTSGRRYCLPCGYRRDVSMVTLVAGNPWWKNLQGGATVELRIAGEDLSGIATPVEDKVMAAEELMAFLLKMPRLAKMYHARLTSDGQPDPASVNAAVDLQVIVRVALHSTPLPSSSASQARGRMIRSHPLV